ncbi:hypothetical protein JCM19239_6313 [Vibrio variabilis]|uniref:Uncharacterized protein n=1 Tax=Vibrio variabilis TaxID=990271 RepID=A0ABQ0J9E6_9VIBR|nr:hypothetical protein JCM19239_6313 [Vibrio variabilis]
MKKILLALATALLTIIALLAWVFIPTHERIGPQTNEIGLNDESQYPLTASSLPIPMLGVSSRILLFLML